MHTLDEVTAIPFVGLKHAQKLKNLGITKIGDFFTHIPRRYIDFRIKTKISALKPDETATIVGQVVNIQNIYTKKGKLMQVANITDGEKKINVLWFNQPYLTRAIPIGSQISISGKVSFWQKKLVIFSPQYEIIKSNLENVHTGRLIPIYPETEGITSKWLRSRINYLLKFVDQIYKDDFLQEELLREIELPSLVDAVKKVHKPKSPNEARLGRDRLAFNELLEVQLTNNLKKLEWERSSKSHKINFKKKDVEEFCKNLPFELTSSQRRSIDEIAKDLAKTPPMNRLLEGDVGSGKTVVAAFAAYICFLNGLQTILMAPTQILANQHFKSLEKLLQNYKTRISLVTGSKIVSDKGRVDVIVGTTALLFNKADFEKVALVIVDEQHKFGVKQRAALANMAKVSKNYPNILTMTATPIPRSIALTLYGDLDLSTLDEMPIGRQKITTWIIPERKRNDAYEWIKTKVLKDNSQVYVVCPLIEESDDENLAYTKAAKVEFDKLKKIFPTLSLGLIHGKIKSKEKEKILLNFNEGKIQILVSTPVIEVGIDIPNATIIVIESADRFGLAQLHQLRGRVGRSDVKSYCLLMTENKSEPVIERLQALKTAKSGRELAEFDLTIRGAGDIFGVRQHGVGELKIATWQDIELIKKSRKLAIQVVNNQDKNKKILDYFKQKQVAPN